MYRQRKQRSRKLTVAAVAAVAALVPLAAACGSEKAGDGSGSVGAEQRPVTGVAWRIDSVTVDGTTHRAPDAARVSLTDRGEAEGSTGCNTFSARADVDDGSIRLSDAVFTEKACAKTPAAFEKSLGRTLTTGALTTKNDGERLTLTTAGGDTVRLSKEPDARLDGTTWTVTTPAPKARAHLTFDTGAHTVSGRLPCNRVRAEATVSDGRITLGAPSTTRMMCEGSRMDAEKRILSLFDGRADYRIDQQTLTLTSEDGEIVQAVAAP